MRAAVALAALMILAGCQTGLPAGWNASNPTAWGNVATVAQERVYGPEAPTTAPVPMLAATGRVGAAEYQALSLAAVPTQECARAAVRAMREYCETLTPPMDYTALTATIRAVCGVAANDADQCIGLMVAARRAARDSP